MKDDTKEILEILIEIISMQNDALKLITSEIKDLQKAIADQDARMATPTEIHNHYHNDGYRPLGPPNPIPVTPPTIPTYPWQFPIVSHGPWSVSTDPNTTYTVNNSFPKPEDDGREGIAVH